LPHFPALDRVYYLHPEVGRGNGCHLAGLLDRFTPATAADRSLLRSLIATLFWGGPPGQRPAFLITTAAGEQGGIGAGKSSVIALLGQLAGGVFDLARAERIETIKKRLLSPEARTKRLVRLDNIKGTLSGEELENLITSPTIGGHRLYHGEAERPNLFTMLITTNGATLSRDMAQRCIPIHLGQAVYSPDWLQSTQQYIRQHHWDILADIRSLLEADPGEMPEGISHSRWACWEHSVLLKVPNAGECLQAIRLRQAEAEDVEEPALVRGHFQGELQKRGLDPETACVFIPSPVAAGWLSAVLREPYATNAASRELMTLSIAELAKSKKDGVPGWCWRGAGAPVNATMQRLPNVLDSSAA
jgi:hypothetical protein